MASMVTDAVPPALAKPMIRFGVRAGVVRKLRAGNLMISNVPGPDFPLYFAGMRMDAVYPIGPMVDGVALNITVQSYEDTLYVGINSGASALPDLPGLARAMVDELALLGLMARGTAGERMASALARPSGARRHAVRAPGRPDLHPRRRGRISACHLADAIPLGPLGPLEAGVTRFRPPVAADRTRNLAWD